MSAGRCALRSTTHELLSEPTRATINIIQNLVLKPRSLLVSTTRVVASIVGVVAGLVGIYHGYNEVMQGNGTPSGVIINAIGPPCQGNCFPAMTVIPSFYISGITTIILGLIVIAWAGAFVQRKYGGLILIALSAILLLVGGGFVPPILGVIAGVIGTRVKRT